MAIRVQQGPLPQDFTRNDSSTFLEDWINGTEIFDISNENFDSDFGLVASQTEAPATTRGALWFERGSGRLWIRDDPDRGDSRYTNSHWVMMAPSREVLVQLDFNEAQAGTGRLGSALSMAYDATTVGVLDRKYTDTRGREVTYMTPDGIPSDSTVMSNFIMLQQETQVSGYETRALEWGFGTALMASGASSVPGRYVKVPNNSPLSIVPSPNGEDWLWHCRQTDVSETNLRNIAIMTGSGGSEAPHLLGIFKRPTTSESWYD